MPKPTPFPLTSIRLRFHCVAESPIQLGGLRAGSNLRGALVNVMRRATCAGDPSDAAHLAVCPVCWLVAARDHPGQERRGYVITLPLEVEESLEPGAGFGFHITLFGDAARYLPYFVLAVPETGRVGVGPGRGRFALKTIHAEHPLNGDWTVLAEGENIVRPPAQPVAHADILQAAGKFTDSLGDGAARLRLDFLTPLRIILEERLLKSPDFGAIFNHILRRLDELAVQHAGGTERPFEERQRLWDLANRVRLVESQANWVDVRSGSSRTGQPTWISGLVGPAWYNAPVEVWRELLPWLVWGEIAQVGKDTSKGNGVYRFRFGDDEK
jgi:hypothetical protein